MKVIVAIDSLKGSLSSLEAGAAIKKGIHRVLPNAEVCVCPLADGGEGTVEALTLGMGGRVEKVSVTGPLGDPVECAYGILEERRTAILEVSGAAGLTLIPERERNPMNTTTYGVGEVIKDAIGKGCRHFIVGLGGSATNDGGIGMLQALGYGMLDANGKQVARGARGLKELRQITDAEILSELRECTFRIACDVTSPLCGKQGASVVYGPQKGATPAMILEMDEWLNDYAKLAAEKYSEANPNHAGAGAAGGLGFAFLTFTNAVSESGVKIVLEETKLEDYIKEADIVITGEGRLDGQTVMGKAPIGVAGIAKKYGKTVLAFCGSASEDARACNDVIDAYFPILREPVSLKEAMEPDAAGKNMVDAAEQVFRLIKSVERGQFSQGKGENG